MRSTRARSAASSAGGRVTTSRAASNAPCAGTSTTQSGVTPSSASVTSASASASLHSRNKIRRFTEVSQAGGPVRRSAPYPRALETTAQAGPAGESMALPLVSDQEVEVVEPVAEVRAAKLQREIETPPPLSDSDGALARREVLPRVLYWGVHAAALGALWTGADPTAVALFAATFWGRMFGVTAGYHRYFAHKTYRTSRAFQFALALLGASATQKGPLWWAGLHRRHHRF